MVQIFTVNFLSIEKFKVNVQALCICMVAHIDKCCWDFTTVTITVMLMHSISTWQVKDMPWWQSIIEMVLATEKIFEEQKIKVHAEPASIRTLLQRQNFYSFCLKLIAIRLAYGA